MIKLIQSAVVLLMLTSMTCSASLMITPLRASFFDNKRSDEIILVNNSEEVNSYRLEWVEQMALPQGGYRPLTAAEAASFPSASKFLRYSPRQVTLKPGESQTIKLVLRKPNNLPAGEYRSHLRFRAIPKTLTPEAGINVYAIMSYAIPVIVKQGPKQAQVSLEQVSMATLNGKPQLKLTLNRAGTSSVIGNVQVFYKASGSNNQLEIAKYNDFSIYPEVKQSQLTLINTGEMPTSLNGILKLVYSGTQEWSGTTFASKEYQVSGGNVRPLN